MWVLNRVFFVRRWNGAVHAICEIFGAILPFALFQGYGYAIFCGADEGFEAKDWCQKTIPSLYSYVQVVEQPLLMNARQPLKLYFWLLSDIFLMDGS